MMLYASMITRYKVKKLQADFCITGIQDCKGQTQNCTTSVSSCSRWSQDYKEKLWFSMQLSHSYIYDVSSLVQ